MKQTKQTKPPAPVCVVAGSRSAAEQGPAADGRDADQTPVPGRHQGLAGAQVERDGGTYVESLSQMVCLH